MIAIRYPVLISFLLSLIGAAFLGFGSIQLHHDKLIHLCTFYLLTLQMWFIFESSANTDRIIKKLIIAAVTLACVFSEIVQGIINPSRVFDIQDIMYNFAGFGLALLTCATIKACFNRQSQTRYTPVVESDADEEDYVNVQLSEVPPATSIR